MGLQHALSMVGGIITPPLIIGLTGFTNEGKSYLVSAALIVSSIASLIQIIQFKIPGTRYVIGSGLLSVMGISFSFVPIAQQVISTLGSCQCGGVVCTPGTTCNSCAGPLVGNCLTAEQAYGKVLGTVAVSFCPPRILRRIFPPVVTGSCLVLLGIALVGTGFQQWGGGSGCASQVLTTKATCVGNGEVSLPFGHRDYLGLGLVVFFAVIAAEVFGSPFMRNTQVLIGLVVGMVVASAVHYTDCSGGTCHHLR